MLIVFGVAIVGVLVEAFLPRQQSIRRSTRALPRRARRRAGGRGGARAGPARDRRPLRRDGRGRHRHTCVVPAGHHPAGRCAGHPADRRTTDRRRRPRATADPGPGCVHPAGVRRPGAVAEQLATKAGIIQTEVFPLTMFAIGGMLLFPASDDLLTMFIALEVLSLPLYLLCGLARRRRLLSQEAALKYFLLGAFSSAFFLTASRCCTATRAHWTCAVSPKRWRPARARRRLR